MQFLYPGFLWALGLLAIPIIIHLFHFRRFKKVYFSNVAFLKEIKEEVSARSRLKNLLVLLMRLLALAFLVLAFAQPFLKQDDKILTGVPYIGLIMDNSFSMTNASSETSLLQQAKQRALEIVSSAPETQKFTLLTNDLEARHQYMLDRDEVSAYIEEINTSPKPFDLELLQSKMTRTLKDQDSDNLSVFVMSDFGVSDEAVENITIDTTIQWYLTRFSSVKESNISIDSAWIESPVIAIGEETELKVRISNRGDQTIDNIRLNVQYQGQSKPVSTISLAPGESRDELASFSPTSSGWYDVVLQITDYPIQFDDKYYLSFLVPERIDVLVLQESAKNKYIEAALEATPILNTDWQSSRNISYNDFGKYSLIILDQLKQVSSGLAAELRKFTEQGGHVFFIPHAESAPAAYSGLLASYGLQLGDFQRETKKVSSLNEQEFVFDNVFLRKQKNVALPQTKGHFGGSRSTGIGVRSILRYRDGSPYLTRSERGQGNLFALYSPLDLQYNDLVGNAEIFVPLLYRMAVSANAEKSPSHLIGQAASYRLRQENGNQDPVFTLSNARTEIIPRVIRQAGALSIVVDQGITEAGIYDVKQQDESVAKMAFNYDRAESRMDRLEAEEVSRVFGGAKVYDGQTLEAGMDSSLTGQNGIKSLWKWCVIFVLIFLVLESLLLRFWKA